MTDQAEAPAVAGVDQERSTARTTDDGQAPTRRSSRSAVMALGIAAAMLGAPPMGRRIRTTGDKAVDAELDRALTGRANARGALERIDAAEAKRARKRKKRCKDASRNDGVDRSWSTPDGASALTPAMIAPTQRPDK